MYIVLLNLHVVGSTYVRIILMLSTWTFMDILSHGRFTLQSVLLEY